MENGLSLKDEVFIKTILFSFRTSLLLKGYSTQQIVEIINLLISACIRREGQDNGALWEGDKKS